ncbi:uncharacterized protein LOC115673802 isoform X1 [Syzygium oleosum]|uniref:uncharacterized protein LOC115673802 isoform X1 n=1 Tax=Syzygium oleosum TaxID=219896 RepID=UPI0011D1D138|nr:uncharacterized protein LOC115673802 isoform X1 [Syzygium oleosum]XP_056169462.1 uncharacterized protein LOC115673802 isoform X1 [Syzygium oleosum]
MENSRRQVGNSSSSSSSPNNTNASNSLDHLFGPKDSFSPSSGSFGSIFPPPSTVLGRINNHSRSETYIGSPRNPDLGNQVGSWKYGNPGATKGQSFKGDGNIATSKAESAIYQNEAAEPCYLSSSIYYGGQENYPPRTAESDSLFKKDGVNDDPNGSNSDSASRGNWWQGSLYY